jgi:predicted RNA-binding protein YlxR (DUF448 family)
LVRVVRSPTGDVILDERGKLPGRGAYLCARLECVEKARKAKSLSRALKIEVKSEVYDRLTEYLSSYGAPDEAIVQKELRLLLGLARRADMVYIGVDSVKSHSGGEPLLILTAADCSGPVGKAARDRTEGGKHVHLGAPLSVADLSSALGADGVQVIALPDRNGLTDKIKMMLFSMEGRVALEQNEGV